MQNITIFWVLHHLIAKFCTSLRSSEFGAILIWFRIISLQNLIIFWVLHHLTAKFCTSLRYRWVRSIPIFLSSLASSHCKTHYKSSTQWGRSNPSLISHHLSAKSSTRAILFFFLNLASSHCKIHYKSPIQWSGDPMSSEQTYFDFASSHCKIQCKSPS